MLRENLARVQPGRPGVVARRPRRVLPDAPARAGRVPAGHHHLVLGNHDKAHAKHRDAHKHLRAYLEVFESVAPYARRRIDGREVLLSHYPYATDDGQADRGEVRDTQYRLPNEGRWLLHGHTHMADQRVHGRQIHVGLDAWGMQPVHLDTIRHLIVEEEAAEAERVVQLRAALGA